MSLLDDRQLILDFLDVLAYFLLNSAYLIFDSFLKTIYSRRNVFV